MGHKSTPPPHHQRLIFLPVSKARMNKVYINRKGTYAVYLNYTCRFDCDLLFSSNMQFDNVKANCKQNLAVNSHNLFTLN